MSYGAHALSSGDRSSRVTVLRCGCPRIGIVHRHGDPTFSQVRGRGKSAACASNKVLITVKLVLESFEELLDLGCGWPLVLSVQVTLAHGDNLHAIGLDGDRVSIVDIRFDLGIGEDLFDEGSRLVALLPSAISAVAVENLERGWAIVVVTGRRHNTLGRRAQSLGQRRTPTLASLPVPHLETSATSGKILLYTDVEVSGRGNFLALTAGA